MNRNIARIAAGFILAIVASAMHGTASEYATEPADLVRLATARSVNFAASVMDMGAGTLILIGAVPFFLRHFGRPISLIRGPETERIALNPPESPESL